MTSSQALSTFNVFLRIATAMLFSWLYRISVSPSKELLRDSNGFQCTPNLGGLTALHFAVLLPGKCGVEMTEVLLRHGANANARAQPDGSCLVNNSVSL